MRSRFLLVPAAALAFAGGLTLDLGASRASQAAPPPAAIDTAVLKANPYYAPLKQVFLGGALSRPSSVSGRKYADVSRAYSRAIHSVLTGQDKAAPAVVALRRELEWITGLPPSAAR